MHNVITAATNTIKNNAPHITVFVCQQFRELLDAGERLRVLHDFYRPSEESQFQFDLKVNQKMGRDFKDAICPDSLSFRRDYFVMGNKYGRVLFLKEYAAFIKDKLIRELTDLDRNLMLSIDVIPVPTDEAVRETQNRLLGVETNVASWQRNGKILAVGFLGSPALQTLFGPVCWHGTA